MRHWAATLALGLALAAAVAGDAKAQETVNYASVGGQVVDTTGAVIQGARVAAKQTDTSITATALTDREGRFRFPYLRTGPYEIVVSQTGFTSVTRSLTLTVGAAFDLRVAMTVASLESSVTVTSDAPVLETARSQIAGTLAQQEIKTTPLLGRNFLDLALLIPGVSPTNVGGGTQLFPETSAVPGVGVSISSQRNLSNNFLVDGLSANDDAAALSGIPYAVDAVEQFQVVTSGGQAELGRALGGYISVATRSGTNRLRTELYEYARDDRFNGVNALSGQKLPMRQHQYGAGIGGPLVRDRTFFFGNVEQRRLDQSGLVTISDQNVAVINARLAALGYAGTPVATGAYSNPIDTTNVLAKVDHQLTSANHLSVRYSLYDAASTNARGAGGLNAPSASAGLDNLDRTIAIGSVLVLSNRMVLETRAQYAHSDLQAVPTDQIGPAVAIAGVATFGTLSGSPTGRVNRMSQVVSNLSYQAGAHAIRAGVDVLYNDLDIRFPRSIRGAYTFSTLANFLAGAYNASGFTQTFGASAVHQTNPNAGFYAQDEWKASSRLTLNLGLRYDLQVLDTIHTDTNNFAPRIGMVWSPSASGRSLIRASAGIFYDRVPLRAVANALLSAGNSTDAANLRQIAVTLSPSQSGAPVFPAILDSPIPSVTLPNFTTIDPHLQNAYSRQASVEFERQVGSGGTFSVAYEHLRGVDLIMQINQNVAACATSGSNNGCRPNPAYANNNQYSSAGSSVYDGLHVSFVQRPSRWSSYRVWYTWSRSLNNVGEAFFNSPLDPHDISKDWGPSDDDQRHRVMFSGTLSTPQTPATSVWEHLSHGFQFSGTAQVYSALPFNITTGANTIQGTPARPIVDGEFIGRNAGRGSAFSTVSLRVNRKFVIGRRGSLEVLVEAFNALNRRNDIARITVFGTGVYPSNPAPNFGQVTVIGDPRTLQFGLRASF